ncbi:MAG: AraC family transcriptional regulator [Defluviitaleaceae bacterium]|nr:AraC family transcriptional regulator [Defluviitaleaceae bacterium]
MDKMYINKAKTFIGEHLKEEFSLNDLAGRIGYSAFHLARAFKNEVGLSVMEYTRNERIMAASKELGNGLNICDIAMEYCFDTHAGFTKAFINLFGCTPKEFQAHSRKMKTAERGITIMENSKIIIRHICESDVQDLWENVYSAMTPKQITEDKIRYHTDLYKKREGFELVAEVDGRVVMSLPVSKPTWLPLGFVWDNHFTHTEGDTHVIMKKLLDETKRQAKMLGISTLISAQSQNSDASKAMQSLGFTKVIESDGWEYLMMGIPDNDM